MPLFLYHCKKNWKKLDQLIQRQIFENLLIKPCTKLPLFTDRIANVQEKQLKNQINTNINFTPSLLRLISTLKGAVQIILWLLKFCHIDQFVVSTDFIYILSSLFWWNENPKGMFMEIFLNFICTTTLLCRLAEGILL